MIAQLTAQVREMAARVEEAVAENGRLAARVGALERRAGKDSSTSSKPPSSDSPYKKKPPGPVAAGEGGSGRPGSSRASRARRCAWWTTRRTGSGTRRRSAGGAARTCPGEEIFAQRRHQVTDIQPAPPPEVTEHVAQSKMCPCCGTVSAGELPWGAWGRGRATGRRRTLRRPPAHLWGPCPRGPGGGADGAAGRARGPPPGWVAGVRAKAAALVGVQRLHGPGGGACCGRRRRCTRTRPRPALPAGCGTSTWPARSG